MRKLIVTLIAVVALIGVTPVFADIDTNLEIFDEVTTGIEISADDFLLSTKYVDVGVKVGVLNWSNPFNNFEAESYVLATINLKKIKLLNRLLGKE